MGTLEKVLEIAKEIFQDDGISPDSPIDGTVGYDSMAIAQFALEVEHQFDISLSDVDVSRLNSVSMYVIEIQKRLV